MKRIWLKSANLRNFTEIEVGDWIEGVGMIMSHFEKDFVRHFGARHLSSQSTQQQPMLLKAVDNWWGCPRCKIRLYRYKKDANNCCR